MRIVWIDPNFFHLYPNSIQTGGVVQFCRNGRGNNETARLIRSKPLHDPSFHFPASEFHFQTGKKIFFLMDAAHLENVGEDDLPVLA